MDIVSVLWMMTHRQGSSPCEYIHWRNIVVQALLTTYSGSTIAPFVAMEGDCEPKTQKNGQRTVGSVQTSPSGVNAGRLQQARFEPCRCLHRPKTHSCQRNTETAHGYERVPHLFLRRNPNSPPFFAGGDDSARNNVARSSQPPTKTGSSPRVSNTAGTVLSLVSATTREYTDLVLATLYSFHENPLRFNTCFALTQYGQVLVVKRTKSTSPLFRCELRLASMFACPCTSPYILTSQISIFNQESSFSCRNLIKASMSSNSIVTTLMHSQS